MALDRTNKGRISQWWWTVDRPLLTLILVLAGIGFLLVMAASPATAERHGMPPFHFVQRHLVFLFLALITMIFISMMPPLWLRRVSMAGLIGTLVLMVAVLLIGAETKGARRWIYLAGFSLQPSELLKPCFVVGIAWLLVRQQKGREYIGYFQSAVLFALVALLLVLQPDFGMTMAFAAAWAGQLFIAGLPIIWVYLAAILGVVGVISAYFALPHVAHRIDAFLNPQASDNYQTGKSLEAFMNGGFFGQGPGQGMLKSTIPDSHTDFIFAVAGEELGIIACIVIVGVYASIIMRGFIRLFSQEDRFCTLATAGLLLLIAIQSIVNMGVSLSLLPNTGMTLPFISYGGSSTLGVGITFGLLLAMTRRQYGRKAGGGTRVRVASQITRIVKPRAHPGGTIR